MGPKPLSNERVEDSSGESSTSDSEALQKSNSPIESTSKVITVKQTSQLSQTKITNSEADDEDDSDGSDASSPSTTSSKSSSLAGSKRKIGRVAQDASEPPAKYVKTSYGTVKRIDAPEYTPPQGYRAASMSASEYTSVATDVFSNLDGKQIWHITAPSSMPISELESLDVQAAVNGAPILKHKGAEYVLARTKVGSASTLLARSRNGEYTAAQAPVSRAYAIQESAKLSKTSKSTPAAASSSQPTNEIANKQYGTNAASLTFFATQPGSSRTPRKQQPNLKARYVPYGVLQSTPFGARATTNGDVTMVDATGERDDEALFQSEATSKSSRKSKQKSIPSDHTDLDETRKNAKKSSKNAADAVVDTSIVDSSQRKKKKDKSKKAAT